MKKPTDRVFFTKEMKKTHTILMPMMLPIHFSMLRNLLSDEGYNVELLTNVGPEVVETGLKYVHNDTCYPALLVIGQMISAIESGKYDVNNVSLIITQTGGGCRASNYIHLLRKALKKAGYPQIPVISFNLSGLEGNSGFKITFSLLRKLLAGVVYGDLLMLLNNQVKPYEVKKGSSEHLVNKWIIKLCDQFKSGHGYKMEELKLNLSDIVDDFNKIRIEKTDKIKVGVVGEIYIKYSSLGNNNLEDFLASYDCEVMIPGLLSFLLFKVDNRLEDCKLYGGNIIKERFVMMLIKYFTNLETQLINAVKKYNKFLPPTPYQESKKLVKGIIGYGNKMGEGWLLTAEMMELVEEGYENIVCTQPFGCLPNHICGKGMIRKIRETYPNANIVTIDYDPGATKVNQENRIKLMLAMAREKEEAKK